MRIPPNKVDEIYRSLDIVDVVGDYVQLKKKGRNYWALSPFKPEKSPSFSVSPDKGIYKCFSTGKGGNAVSFVMEVEGFSYPEALAHLAKKYGIELEYEASPENAGADARRESMLILNKFAADFFHRELLQTDEGKNIGLTYFQERGFSPESVEKFQLGYCNASWNALTEHALKNKYQESFLIESGLSIKSEKNGRLFDRFHSRVMFPIHDVNGKIVGFGGRILGKADKTAKYVNSPESIVYNKSRLLYGLFFARNAIRQFDECVLVEGYTDVVSMHQAGVQNVVASSGTSLTEDQIKLISRFTKNITVIYDGDKAGVNASLRGVDMILEKGLSVRVLQLPAEHDPDSFVKLHGGEHFRNYLKENSLDFISFKIEALTERADRKDPLQRAHIIGEVARSVAKMQNEIQRSVMTQFAAEKLQTDETVFLNAVNQELERLAKHGPDPAPFTVVSPERNRQSNEPPPLGVENEGASQPNNVSELFHQERELIRLMLNHFDSSIEIEGETVKLCQHLDEAVGEAEFQTPIFEQIKNILLESFRNRTGFPQIALLEHPSVEIRQTAAELMSERHILSENWLKNDKLVPLLDADLFFAIEQALLHFQRRHYTRLLKENQAQMKTETDIEQQIKLLTRQKKIQHLLRQVTDKLGIVIG